jgi:CheY-like chemotaxis protein
MKNTSILVVEDDSMTFESLKKILENLGYANFSHVTNGMDAIAAAKLLDYEIILMDIGLEGKLDGIDTSALLDGKSKVIFTSGNHKDGATFSRVAKTGGYGFISKPYTSQQVREALENALKA